MLIQKIEGSSVKIIDGTTGIVRRVIHCSGYKDPKLAEIQGKQIAIACGDGKTRLFDLNNGVLKRTF
jgi:hypothetical protein